MHHRKRAQSMAGVLCSQKRTEIDEVTQAMAARTVLRYYGTTRLRLDMTVNIMQRPDQGPGRLICGVVPSDDDGE